MRPANLIPVEERRRRGGGLRSASLAYVLVGTLLIALGAVTLLVVTNNQVASRKAEVATAIQETEAAKTRASELTSFTRFHEASVARTVTISNLAKSRFDWEGVMEQLALVLPKDVWLTNLTGSVRPDVSVGGGESVSLRSAIAGPALSMAGCAMGQEGVAGFITALKDISGVTRVGVQSSADNGESGAAASASGGCSGFGVVGFQLVVAFDAAPVPTAVGVATEEVVEAPAPAEGSSEEAPAETSESSEPAPAG